jgi:hypothetical protein
MPAIDERSRAIFKDVAISLLSNFTVGEVAEIEGAAAKLLELLKRAKQREQQERLTK